MTSNPFPAQAVGNIFIVRPSGYLGDEACLGLKSQVLEALNQGAGKVLIDLAAVAVINSPGITRLLEIAEEVTGTHRADLGFVGVTDLYRDVFQVTGLSSLATIFEDEPQAIREL